ncbi:hypothetical protein C8J56DRAFT_930353 [Mycena floridula]|nr:hypothetical protein C8J56DRAFT_930353 [Mycena floridula]
MQPTDLPHEPDILRLSPSNEPDNLSDSDWLDIASSRESDDYDSVSSNDATSLPPSRRSSISVGSSRDGEVDGWEGFTSDVSDVEEEFPVADNSEPILQGGSHRLFVSLQSDTAEERVIREALDQSMISTLSASRSNSHPSTAQNSLGDLRLSFPDPLTSSRDELIRSFEEVATSDDIIAHETSITSDSEDDKFEESAPETLVEPPGTPSIADVVASDGITVQPPPHFDVDIVLYGASSPLKLSFVHDLLGKVFMGNTPLMSHPLANCSYLPLASSKWAAVQGFLETVSDGSRPACPGTCVRWLTVPEPIQPSLENFAIYDRTADTASCSKQPSFNRPSLAIVYLPCQNLTLPEHTYYLPVLLDDTVAEQAETAWNMFGIPAGRVFDLTSNSSSILHLRDVPQLNKLHAVRTFQRLDSSFAAKKKGADRRFTSVQAVTLFALMTLIVGFTINTSFRSAAPPTPTFTPSEIVGANSNSTTAVALRTTSNIAVVSHFNYASPAYNRGSTLASSSKTPEGKSTTSAVAWSERMKASTDVIVRPPTTLSSPSVPSAPATIVEQVTSSATATSSSLSIRLADSLSEIMDATKKALSVIVNDDMKELTDAIDALVQAIRRQVAAVIEDTKGTVELLRSQLRYRNDRAKGKARKLKLKSQQIISSAKEGLRQRTVRARKQAANVKDIVVRTEAWDAYKKAHGEWSAKLKNPKKGLRDKRRAEKKLDRKMHGLAKGDRRKRFFSLH